METEPNTTHTTHHTPHTTHHTPHHVKSSPWFDGEYRQLRKERRRSEKKYKKTRTEEDKERYISLRKQTTKLAHDKKCQHYRNKLKGGNRLLFSSIKTLLDEENEEILPEATSDKELADRFVTYFTEKIEKIRATFQTKRAVTPDFKIFAH